MSLWATQRDLPHSRKVGRGTVGQAVRRCPPHHPLIWGVGWGGALQQAEFQVGQMTTATIKILGVPFSLERHGIEEPPAGRVQEVAYVGFAGTTTIKVALWKRGQWVSDKGGAFSVAPVCWYSIEPTP